MGRLPQPLFQGAATANPKSRAAASPEQVQEPARASRALSRLKYQAWPRSCEKAVATRPKVQTATRPQPNHAGPAAAQGGPHHTSHLGKCQVPFGRGKIAALRSGNPVGRIADDAFPALRGENHRLQEVVGMDQGNPMRPPTGNDMNPAAGDRPEDLVGGRIALAKHDRRTKDRDRHLLGPLPGRLLAGQLAPAVVRNRRRGIAFQPGPSRSRGPIAASDETTSRTRRRGLRGTRPGNIGHAFAIDLIKLLDMDRLDQPGQMIDRIVSRHDPAQRLGVGHVAVGPANRQSCQAVEFRRLADQAAYFVPLVQQRPGKVKSDEAACAGNQYFRHSNSNRRFPPSSPG